MRRLACAAAALVAVAVAPAGAAATALALVRLPAVQTGPTPIVPFIGDTDADGELDVVTPNFGGGTVSVLHGVGDGTLRAKEDFAAGPNPVAVTSGDLRFIGRNDLLVANYGAGLTSLDNDGAGAMIKRGAGSGPTVPFAFGATDVIAVQVTSPIPDIVYSGYSGGGAVAFGANAGCTLQDPPFACPGVFSGVLVPLAATASVPGALALGYVGGWEAAVTDVNGPGIRLARIDDQDSVMVPTGGLVPTGTLPVDVEYGDADGDGQADLLVAEQGGNSVALLRRTSGTSFARSVVVEGCSGANDVAVGDLDRDGKLDLVAACGATGEARVQLGNGDGTFRPGPTLQAEGIARFSKVELADLNGDRALDVVAVSGTASSVTVFASSPAPRVAPARVAFAERDALTASPAVAVRVGNGASGDVAVTGAAITGAGATHFQLVANRCVGTGGSPVPIGPADACTVTVRFAPREIGRLSARLELQLARGGTLAVPLAGIGVRPGKPRLSRVAAGPAASRRGARVALTLSRAAKVTVVLHRRRGSGLVRLAKVQRARGFGASTITLGRRLVAGRYRVTVSGVDGRGRTSNVVVRTFTLR